MYNDVYYYTLYMHIIYLFRIAYRFMGDVLFIAVWAPYSGYVTKEKNVSPSHIKH